MSSVRVLVGTRKGRSFLPPTASKQWNVSGPRFPPRLGNLPCQRFHDRSESAVCFAVERVVWPGDSALQ